MTTCSGSGYWGFFKIQWFLELLSTYLTHSLSDPELRSLGLNFVFQHGDDCCFRKVRQKIRISLCFAAAQLPVLDVTGQSPWACAGVCLHASLWSLGSSPTCRIVPPAWIFTFFFSGPFLSYRDDFFSGILFFATSFSFQTSKLLFT